MRSAATVLGMALIGFLLCPIIPPNDYPGHGLDGKAYGCTQTCDEVVAYHDAVTTANGYGRTYDYKKIVWQDACDTLTRSKICWVEHVNEDCTLDCDGFGPDENCDDGVAAWNAYQAAKDVRLEAYIDMEDAWDDWTDGVAICGVIRLVMLNHCQSHGHAACDWEEDDPVR